jgi:HlyD family secretion protein
LNIANIFKGRTRAAILAGVLALAAGSAWLLYPKGQAAPTYRTQKAARGDITATVSSSGSIAPVVTVTVGTPVSGIIKAIFADFNSQVKKGQVIAQIDPATYSALVEQSKGSYLNAVANVEKARITLADSVRTLKRYQSLVKDGSVAVSDYDTYATAAASAKAALSAAEGSVAQAKGAYDQAKTNLAYTTITSPVDGIVISRAVEVGQTVAASLNTPTLFTIAQDLTKMQINATVDESDIAKVQEGANATFSVDAYPEELFPAVVTQVRNAATTTSNVVTYSVILGVDNAGLKLKPGMTASVTFVAAARQNALKIPTAALRFRPKDAPQAQGGLAPGQKRVYVLKDGRPAPVVVTIGIGNDKETEVTAGDITEASELVLGETTGAQARSSSSSNPLATRGGPGMGPPPR